MLRWLVPLLLLELATAQAVLPDPHWGAWILPPDRPQLRAALRVNRFTEFSKTGQRFNEQQETTGFQLATLTYTENTPQNPDLFFTIAAGVGYSGDQPSRFLQNEYVHGILGQAAVPVGAVREETEYSMAGSITQWFDGPEWFRPENAALDDPGWRTRWFLGAGVATGTIHHEAHAEVGATLWIPDTFLAGRHVRFSLANRLGFPSGSDAFPVVADLSNVTQFAIGFVPPAVRSDNAVLDFFGNPEIGLSITHDTGFFERAGDPIETWFAGLYLQWPTGLRFETWNDFANGTDFGPTYGFHVSFDLFTLFENSRWRW